jgi:hypothetical protein
MELYIILCCEILLSYRLYSARCRTYVRTFITGDISKYFALVVFHCITLDSVDFTAALTYC